MAAAHSTNQGPDLTGLRFELLVALGPVGRRNRSVLWLCRCDCGREHHVIASNLRAGNVKSCGCARGRLIGKAHMKHGHARKGRLTPEYKAWVSARNRCYNTKNHAYPSWGGRGIRMCDRWLGPGGFAAFLADIGQRPSPRHTLGRKDNDGDYCPENCRWETMVEQDNNKRNNVFLTWRGERLTIAQWARKLGVGYGALKGRLYRGWAVDRALATPFKHG